MTPLGNWLQTGDKLYEMSKHLRMFLFTSKSKLMLEGQKLMFIFYDVSNKQKMAGFCVVRNHYRTQLTISFMPIKQHTIFK